MYKPKPIDTSSAALPAELLALTEQMAEHVHDVWAAGRIAEGWTYGKIKNVEKKETPQLVPYAKLPEEEKQYDNFGDGESEKVLWGGRYPGQSFGRCESEDRRGRVCRGGGHFRIGKIHAVTYAGRPGLRHFRYGDRCR